MAKEPTSNLERALQTLIKQLAPNLTEPVWGWRFHPTRKWEMDAAWPAALVCVEVEGQVWGRFVKCQACGSAVFRTSRSGKSYRVREAGGRHVRGKGYSGDCEKYNAAQAMGWIVLRVTGDMLKNDPQAFLDQLSEVVGSRTNGRVAPCSKPDTPQERGAVAGWHLSTGAAVSAVRVARSTGMTIRGCRKMLQRLSRVLPIGQPEPGIWRKV